MYSIHDLPIIERPREKLMRYGTSKLSDQELLAIIFGSGNKKNNVMQISEKVMRFIKTMEIENLVFANFNEVSGIGPEKICKLIACIELGKRLLQAKKSKIYLSPKEVWEELKDIRNNKKEHFIIFFLDARSQEIKREVISIGTISKSIVHPREVFEPAVRYLASHIILAHNHPSGTLTPSEADIQITKRLSQAGAIMGIEILDHIVVTATDFYSLKENRLFTSSASYF